MAIHYENHRRFSRGQGFIGAACRPVSAQAKSARWKAVDCRECKNTLIGRAVISRSGAVGKITEITPLTVTVRLGASVDLDVTLERLDEDWAPMPPMEELFGDKTS